MRSIESRPDRLIFLDHMPHPGALIKALEGLYGRKPLPPMYVHVYGDFTLYSRAWLEIQELLQARPGSSSFAHPRGR